MSIFLTETTTRHSLLTKQKHFRNKEPIKSNSKKLLGDYFSAPITVEDTPAVLREESDDDLIALQDLPSIESDAGDGETLRGSKRSRTTQDTIDGSDDDFFVTQDEPASKRQKEDTAVETQDDKKKLAMDTSYDGFSIYGRVLCLVVKQRDTGKGKATATGGAQAMMEDWITSTQMLITEEDG